jgi:hypothetical protein
MALLLVATGYVGAYLAYRAVKLNLLEPRRLQAPTCAASARATLARQSLPSYLKDTLSLVR